MSIIIANIFGLIASCTDAAGYFRKTKKDIVIVKQFVAFMYLFQNLILHAYTALADVVVSIVRNFVFIKFKNEKLFLVFSIVKIALMLSLGYEGYITWVAVAVEACYSITMSFFSEQALRRVQIIKNAYWSVYSLLHLAIGSGVMNFVSIIIVSVALYKNRKKKENEVECQQ